jgi:hypothetical protein
MYYIEKFTYQDQVNGNEESKRHWQETIEKYGGEEILIRETGFDSDGNRIHRIHESVCDTPKAVDSVYVQNDRYIDLCTSFEDKRGILTMLAVPFTMLGIGGPAFSVLTVIEMIQGAYPDGDPYGVIDYIFGILFALFGIACFVGFCYVFKRFFRLEIFVQRRLLVRFDRINRKVYLHRPRYAGGVVTLDWDKIAFDVGKEGVSAIGMPLCIVWENAATPSGLFELVFVGRLARSDMEIKERWEFIRRFMEDGPQAVPRQKTLAKCPWPWVSVQTTLGLIWPIFHMVSLRWMLPLMLLASPAILAFAAGNWLSLLLCWEPVFPRAIRKACGEKWTDVLKTRMADLIAWTMLVLLLIWLWPEMRWLFIWE